MFFIQLKHLKQIICQLFPSLNCQRIFWIFVQISGFYCKTCEKISFYCYFVPPKRCGFVTVKMNIHLN